MGIRSKLILPLILAWIVFAAVVHLVWRPQILQHEKNHFLTTQKQMLQALEPSLVRDILAGDLASLYVTLNRYHHLHETSWRRLVLLDMEGRQIYPLQESATVRGVGIAQISHTLANGSNTVGILVADVDWTPHLAAVHSYILELEWGLLILFVGVVILGMLWQNRLIRSPLKRLQQATTRMAQGDYSLPIENKGQDEVAQLTRSFELMRQRILDAQQESMRLLQLALESEDRQRAVFENIADGIVIIDDTGEIQLLNEAAERMFGYARHELVGEDVGLLLEQDNPSGTRTGIPDAWRTAPGRQHEQRELRGRRRNGERFELELVVSDMHTGESELHIGIARDITRRKEAEAELHQARHDAEAASRAKSEFLARMSHEIRTPMNGVLGITEILQDTPLDAEQREYVQIVRRSGTVLLRLIDDILDFSKIEAGRMELEQAPFDLFQLIDEVVVLLEKHCHDKGLELILDYPDTVPRVLIGDAARLRQVVLNLVGNAIKFTQQGFVVVRTRAETGSDGQIDLCLEVEDSGIGIEPQICDHLFEPFSQADSSTTRRFGGTGLGLTVSQQLIQLMGGRIGVRSEPGEGSCFRIDLRLARADRAPMPDPVQAVEAEVRPVDLPHFTGHVLVAEDNPVNQTVTSRMLEQLGLSVCLVADGQAALERWQKEAFDLIFMDLRMPRLDGHATSRVIREQEAGTGRRIPIIALTANAQLADREQCLAAGMDDYISKPFDRDMLVRHLETWLGSPATPGSDTITDSAADGARLADTGTGATLQNDLLRRLEEEMGDEFKSLVVTFIESADTQLADMQSMLQEGERETFTRLAHNLKSSSRMLGAVRLSELAARLEDWARGQAVCDQPGGDFDALRACYGEVRRLLQARIGDQHLTG